MNRWIPCLVFLMWPMSLPAQQWSAEEQAVLDQVETCFQSFTVSTETGDYRLWKERCRVSEDAIFWDSRSAGPLDVEGLEAWWRIYNPQNRRSTSPGFYPIRIRLVDDVALVYGYTWWFREKMDGTVEPSEDKRLEVYVKRDGQWGLQSIIWMPLDEAAE